MPIIQKYKLNALAKDFDIKTKDISDILSNHGIQGKSAATILENSELNIVFEYLTQNNQVDNIKPYMYADKSAAAVSVSSVSNEKQSTRAEQPQTSEPVQTKTKPEDVIAHTDKDNADTQSAQDNKGNSGNQDKQPEQKTKFESGNKPVASEIKHTAPRNNFKPFQPKKDEKPNQPHSPNNWQRPNQTNPPQFNNNKQQRPQQPTQFAQRQSTNANQQKQNFQNNPNAPRQQSTSSGKFKQFKPYQPEIPQTKPNPSNQFSQPNQSNQSKQFNQSNQSNQPKQFNQPNQSSRFSQSGQSNQVNQGNRQGTSRYAGSKRDFSAPVFNKDPKQNPRNFPAFKPQNYAKTDGKATVDIISSDKINIKLEAGVRNSGAKIVDTRTSTVDLSKYDEKLNNFVSVPDNDKNYSSDRQKSKRPTQQRSYDRSGKPIDKEKIALERLYKRQQEQERIERSKRKPLEFSLPDEIIISDLAAKLRITSAEVIKKLFMLGTKVSVNEAIDYDTAALVAMEFGAKVEREVIITIEDRLFDESVDPDDMLVSRAPVVVVMGHVDHGKTSLLDAIKDTNVTAGEAGGITQHIGAYRVTANDREITFLDTPGHAAFTAMRARGAKATDVAILVVAADDGIMPQTVEAINHAKAANVAIIVAINKMDKLQADVDKVMQGLTAHNLVPESWGGDIICVPVSAHTKQGIDELLEMVLLTADMKDLKANPSRLAKGIIIEAKLDKGRGPVATVLVQNGTLNVGDVVIAGTTVGRVRAMNNDRGQPVKSAGPSVPVEIIGLSETPNAGDAFRAVEDEKMARELVEQRKSEEKEEHFKLSSNVTLEDLFSQVSSGIKELNTIIKGDVQGSVEALCASLIKESTEEVKIKIIHSAVGGINESDVLLASASNAIIIGFNVRPDKAAIDAAERRGVDIRTYRIIYECIEEINAAMKGMLAPKFREVVYGHAEVRQTIRVPNIGTIAGAYIQDGKVSRNSQIRVVRNGIVIFEDKISSLKRFKDDVKEVMQGYECGIGLERFNDIKESDILESFVMEQVEN